MAPPTKEMVELKSVQDRLDGLEKRFNEMIDGFRSLSARQKQVADFLNEAKTHLEAVKFDVANLKQDKISNGQAYGESKVSRF